MASLKIKVGSPIQAKKGIVELNGQVVAVYESSKTGRRLVYGYCLQPGETVRRIEDTEDDYIVEF